MKKIQYHECRKDKKCYSWAASIGRMEIAHIFYLRHEMTYKVRLYFNIPYGIIDFSKDRDFTNRDEAEKYISNEFKAFFMNIAYQLGYRKNKTRTNGKNINQ